MVETLLGAASGPCSDCRSKGLVKATKNGALRNARILLEKEANPDF
jgi:hypothetical protein